MEVIDFTHCTVNKFRAYGGANGNKINIQIVVACQDFTESGKKLIEFGQLKNTCIDSEQNGYGTELQSIMDAIREQELVSHQEMTEFFWNMFIIDALLGNFDRHNGNWGILVDEKSQSAEIAPVYDCGSCLYPQLAVEDMQHVIENEEEINKRIFLYPTSAIEKDGKKISYFEYISSLENTDCNAALKRIFERIEMTKIEKVIDETPFIEQIQKDFYKVMISERKSKILDYSIHKQSSYV